MRRAIVPVKNNNKLERTLNPAPCPIQHRCYKIKQKSDACPSEGHRSCDHYWLYKDMPYRSAIN